MPVTPFDLVVDHARERSQRSALARAAVLGVGVRDDLGQADDARPPARIDGVPLKGEVVRHPAYDRERTRAKES
jgi:hypothetical protein